MPLFKTVRELQNPNIGLDELTILGVVNVPVGTRVQQGSVWSLDMTQATISPASLLNLSFGGGSAIVGGPPGYTPTAETVVPPFSANAGKVVGVYQGPSFTLPTVTPMIVPLKFWGMGVVLGAAEGGTAINVGSNLVVSTTQYGAKQGTAALNSQVGLASAYIINTSVISGAFASGAQTVTVGSIVGMSTTVPLTIDSVASGVQELVTPSAVVSGVNSNQTFTVGGTVTAAAVLTTTIGGVASTYTTVSGDTATTAAAGVIRGINASTAVTGPGAIILPATQAAGVITVRAITASTATITTVAAIANAGTTTYVAGGATTTGGTANTFTATFANAHGANAIVQGIANANAGVLIPGTSNALTEYLLNAYLQII